jgi:hypothetical protein
VNLKSMFRLRRDERCEHARLDRTAVPPKFSYPKKPVTLSVPVMFTKCCCTTAELLADAIREYVELTEIVPFDWEQISPVPEAYQSHMRTPDDKFYAVYFGFDSIDKAQAAKAKFNAIDRHEIITTEAEERESLQRYFEQIEKESNERVTYDGGDGRGEMYWRDHPYFQEGWRDYCQQVRQERAAVPEKFSYPEKPITLHVPVSFAKNIGSTEEHLADAIRYFTEVAGIVPFDWKHISSVPEAHQSKLGSPDGKFYLVWFGYDTMDEALAAKARFDAIGRDVVITTEEDEPRSLREAPQTELGAGGGPVDRSAVELARALTSAH